MPADYRLACADGRQRLACAAVGERLEIGCDLAVAFSDFLMNTRGPPLAPKQTHARSAILPCKARAMVAVSCLQR